MYSQNDERSSNARGSSASSGQQQHQHQQHQQQPHHNGPGRGFHRYLGSYGSSSTPSSSLENQRSLEAQLSASTVTTSSLFGDPVLPAARHADLLGGEDLYQNLKSNIELYHAKLFSEQERHRQAERDALFEQYANAGGMAIDGGASGFRAPSTTTGGSGSGSGSTTGSGIGSGRPGGTKSTVGHNVMTYGEVPPRTRNFSRTQSAGLGVDLSNLSSNVLDMDLLKQNDWIDFTEHEYRHSLIPTTSRTVADVQQFAGANIPRKIENGVFQNPRAAAAARASRRNSVTDSMAMYGSGLRSAADSLGAMADKSSPGLAPFTVLGHGHSDTLGYEGLPHGGMHDFSTSSEANSEYERMLRYGRTDPSTAIIRDKINTGSQNRVSDARQHKNTAFTIINEVLPKSSSYDMSGSMRYSPYREKHRAASSRILSASSAYTGTTPGYGYGYGSEYAEEGSISTAPFVHPGIRRRFSSSELSMSMSAVHGGRKAEASAGSSRSKKRPTKSKTSLSIAGRRQPGVLEVMSKKSNTVPSAKVTITQPSEDGRSLTPTPSESGLSGTGTIEGDRISIPEHQLRNVKLFGYKPFSGGRALSPVPDKSSMENSQADLKLDSSSSGSAVAKKGPVFNIRGLLSPRAREKPKTQPSAEGEQVSRSPSKEPPAKEEGAPGGEPPKKRRFNLARAIIESARGGGGGPAPEPEKAQPKASAVAKKETSPQSDQGPAGDKDAGERRKLALKMKLGIVRSGVRKDSEGNGVKEKKVAKGKKGQAGGGAASSAKGGKKQTKSVASAKGAKKGSTSKGKSREYDDYEEDDDDYGASYGRRGLDLGTKKSKKSTSGGGGGGGGGGMLKSALSYAASFRSRSDRVGTAAGARSKSSTVEQSKGAKGTRAAGKEMEKMTPNARRREKSAKGGNQAGMSSDGRGKSGSRPAPVGGRVKSGKSPVPGRASNRAKSAAGPRGKMLRRSSSTLALDVGQQRKMNKLYEKNQKASTGPGGLLGLGGRGGKSSSSLISKANRHTNDGNASSGQGAGSTPGGSMGKSDSRGELRGSKTSIRASGDGGATGGGSDTKERFEKRDSDRSLKKSDSNKSLATMGGGKPKKSDSKSSLLTKRSDSRSSLLQTAAGGAGAESSGGGDASGTEMGGKSPHNSVHESAPEASGVKSARPTPKLVSKGSLLSLMSLKGSRRNLDRAGAGAAGAPGGEGGAQRPDTAAGTMASAADGTMGASSTRLKSASVRNAPGAANGEGGGGDADGVGTISEKPMSTKPLRRLKSRGSLLSIKSIAHARSFTNVRPPTAAGADAAGGGGGGGGAGSESMPPQTMTKVTEGSQEHDDTTDTETSGHGGTAGMGGPDGQGSMGVATHELTVAGDGEGEKVSNEYNGDRMRSPMAEHKQKQQHPGSRSPDMMDNVSSANTESMRDRTMGHEHTDGGGGGNANNSDEFDEDEQLKCSKCCCACCAPCWTRTCLPFRRCFRSCSGCCGGGRRAGGGRLGKRKADGQLASQEAAQKAKDANGESGSCWSRLLGCCRRCRNSKTSPETALVPKKGAAQAESTKKSCWQSLNCCASCRRNKSRELVPRSSIDSDPPAEEQSRCRSCWSKLLCCCRPKSDHPPGKSNIKRTKMVDKEPVEMETVKCCFCFKRQRPKVKAKPKRKVPVKSTFNCFSCCMMCCRKKGDSQSRRTSNLSKKQSIAPTIPPEDLRPKIDMSLVEHSSLMRGAIPVLPLCLAYFCLMLNVLLPGMGTVLSGGLCLCIGKPRFSQHDSIKGRIGSFIINCIVGISQCFTIIFCVVGWGWAIWWGTIMLRLAKQHQKILEMEAAQEEAEDQTTLSQRTGASNPPVALVSKTHRDVETGR